MVRLSRMWKGINSGFSNSDIPLNCLLEINTAVLAAANEPVHVLECTAPAS